ncbi:MAG: Asp23/Gls24 family envelope stress response protein [Chloroflexota bacterium]|nr:Asp23/Gls24 family envelope stress response protein [Chloroflexota bacterium]
MTDSTRPPGKTTVATSVLLNITRLTTLQVQGVSRMYQVPGGVNRIFHKGDYGEGVRIKIEADCVYADIHVVLNNDVNIREVSRNIQHEVKRSFSKMVGMEVGHINIHIEDIDYPTSKKPLQANSE